MRNAQVHFVQAQTMASTFHSNPVNLTNMFGVCVQAIFATSGTLGGTFTLEISTDHVVDQAGNIQNAGHWDVVQNSSQTIAAAGTFSWDNVPTNAPWIRLSYAPAGGDTGTLDAWAFTKGF